MNQVALVGNIGQNPFVKYDDNGVCRVFLSLGVHGYSTAEKKSFTDWHDVRIKGKLAEIAGNHLTKGSLISVNGTLKSYLREKDGVKFKVTYVLVSAATKGSIQFLKLKKGE